MPARFGHLPIIAACRPRGHLLRWSGTGGGEIAQGPCSLAVTAEGWLHGPHAGPCPWASCFPPALLRFWLLPTGSTSKFLRVFWQSAYPKRLHWGLRKLWLWRDLFFFLISVSQSFFLSPPAPARRLFRLLFLMASRWNLCTTGTRYTCLCTVCVFVLNTEKEWGRILLLNPFSSRWRAWWSCPCWKRTFCIFSSFQ